MKNFTRTVGAVMALWLSPCVAASDAMKEIMLDLSDGMTQINAGIWREDYQGVAAGAASIAEHPMPPFLQRIKLLAELGGDSSAFMRADDAMREAALDLKKAAMSERTDEVLVNYKVLHQRCVDCHSWYRGKSAAQTQAPGREDNGK
ncbi:MAG: hypothetical protein R6X15_00535 [Pseudomonadota bacterium]